MNNNKLLPSHALTPRYHRGHPQTVAVFQTIAEGFDVNVTKDHRRYWRSMLTIGRALDTIIDNRKPYSLQDEHDRLIAGLPIPGVNELEAEEFSDILRTVSPERHDAIIEGLAFNDYAIAMRSFRGYSNFINLRIKEAELFGRVMQLDNPNSTPETNLFNAWLPRFARAGYLIDSFNDLYDDYRDGLIAVQPTIARRLRLGKTALIETKNAISDLPPQTIAFLAIASLSKIIRNGLRKK